jgi:glutathione synthase/RimK-type ligase-like ATP-grasp enzyme
LYYQEFIKSKWEYKVYAIGEDLYFYKQLPILVNPNKMQSRREIRHIPELEEVAYKAIHALNLEISSIDFLKSKKGIYYLTDINSSPNFNYLKNGPQLVGDYLIQKAKR